MIKVSVWHYFLKIDFAPHNDTLSLLDVYLPRTMINNILKRCGNLHAQRTKLSIFLLINYSMHDNENAGMTKTK